MTSRVLISGAQRAKLANYNTIDDAIDLMLGCERIVVITGAGISVSCGIPDFRSHDGFYSRLNNDRCRSLVSEPEEVFSFRTFLRRPSIFYRFVGEIIRFDAEPSFSHHFLRVLDATGRLLRNYTQNVDTLELKAGILNVEHCHGSFEWFSCTSCGQRATLDEMRAFVELGIVPYCWTCMARGGGGGGGIFKPNIVFFEEGLPISFNLRSQRDKTDCDLVIVIGSSMTVKPICLLPSVFPINTPRILINKEALSKNRRLTFDIELLGDCDVVLQQICFGIIQRGGPDAEPYARLMRTKAPHFVPMRMIDTIDTESTDTSSTGETNITHPTNLCSQSHQEQDSPANR